MKIAIDINSSIGRKTGIGYYTHNLLKQYKTLGKDFEFHYFFDPRKTELNTLERIVWANFRLVPKFKKTKADLLHITGFAGPLFTGKTKKVTTVHDLIGMLYPKNLRLPSRIFWSKWLPLCVKTSDHIIADSLNTKKDIIHFLKIPDKKISVIYLAADNIFRPLKNTDFLENVRKKYCLPKNFILHVGTIEPRKNIPRLIEAFSQYINGNSSDLFLVILGSKEWGYPEAVKQLEKFNVANKIIFTDYVDFNDMPAIYNLSKFFIYPSLYEGFGLPVLEAMACGKAVICSNSSSLPEITDGAAILIDPLKTNEIVDAIKLLDNNVALNNSLSEKSLLQALKFSWEKTAKETLEIYKKVVV